MAYSCLAVERDSPSDLELVLGRVLTHNWIAWGLAKQLCVLERGFSFFVLWEAQGAGGKGESNFYPWNLAVLLCSSMNCSWCLAEPSLCTHLSCVADVSTVFPMQHEQNGCWAVFCLCCHLAMWVWWWEVSPSCDFLLFPRCSAMGVHRNWTSLGWSQIVITFLQLQA